ncbi:MAG: Omp28 family outer membrane lipoprotein [Muribaculaceae bacterium]|nr:Omp28 family outer membrane lipoprotein [Muribaculaceae bacterium]
MTRYKYIFSLFATIVLVALSACDNVDDDDRLIYVKPATVQRAVLIEDFTGQRCVNCPSATAAIDQLIEQYGSEAVIAVGIHSGPFSRSPKGTRYALGTDEGDEYFAYWQFDRQPIGMVNRRKVSDYTEWATQVYNEIQSNAPVSIDVVTNYDPDTRQLDVATSMMALDGTVAGKLQLWIVEDGIVAFQYMPDNSTDREYVHNHVLRCAINGTWGQDVNITEGNTTALTSQITLDSEWNADNVSVVAFVYNDSGVLQVVKKALIETELETEN